MNYSEATQIKQLSETILSLRVTLIQLKLELHDAQEELKKAKAERLLYTIVLSVFATAISIGLAILSGSIMK
jgi:hypothetical protein